MYFSSVSKYTREAGVRSLERKIGAVCRAVTVKVITVDAVMVIVLVIMLTVIDATVVIVLIIFLSCGQVHNNSNTHSHNQKQNQDTLVQYNHIVLGDSLSLSSPVVLLKAEKTFNNFVLRSIKFTPDIKEHNYEEIHSLLSAAC